MQNSSPLFKLSWPAFSYLLIILVFCVTRFYRLEDFPVYFFCDEAFIGVTAHKLFANYFFSDDGTFLPMYWEKAKGRWVPQISIYLSMVPSLLWPRSIVALRAVTGVVSLTGILIMEWGIRKADNAKSLSWLPLGLATITPVLFLHNRLAFETSNVISGLFASLGFYLAYRIDNFKYLTGFVLTCLFTFYSHLSGTIVITAIVLALLVIDWPYRMSVIRKQGMVFKGNLIFALFAFIPLFVFLIRHSSAPALQLSILGSDLTKDLPLSQVVLNGALRYVRAFDPSYWCTYHLISAEIRHLWKDRSFIPLVFSAPFFIGLTVSLLTIRSIRSRTAVIFLLAGPLPVFFVETHIQRVFYLIPAIIFLTYTGITFVLGVVRVRFLEPSLSSLLLAGVVYSAVILTGEIRNASLWYSDYGISGLQWGAQAMFRDAIPRLLNEDPNITIVPSNCWANGAESFPEFFLDKNQLKRLVTHWSDFFHSKETMSIPPEFIFVLDPVERMMLEHSQRFKTITPVLEIPFPDGSRGFTFSRIEYVDNIEEVMAWQRLHRHHGAGRVHGGHYPDYSRNEPPE